MWKFVSGLKVLHKGLVVAMCMIQDRTSRRGEGN